ncbi:MAG: hypothetical protein WB699_03515 [Bacteroidota bacterium]
MTNTRFTGPLWRATVTLSLAIGLPACGLFQTRTPDAPTQPSDSFIPATDPDAVVQNLQSAIAEKSSVNYVRCLADPSHAKQPYQFIPSATAAATYSGVFAQWNVDDERQYFQNLVARTAGKPTAFSNLVLAHKTILLSGDSTVVSYDYTFTFDHNDPSFPTVASGTMQLVLGPDNTNAWVIYRWTDFKTTNDITWSHFKGRFSN